MSTGNNRVFGQATRRGNSNSNSNSRYQRQTGNDRSTKTLPNEDQELALKRKEYKQKRKAENDEQDKEFGFDRYMNATANGRTSRRGWIFNILPTVRNNVTCVCDFTIALLFWTFSVHR